MPMKVIKIDKKNWTAGIDQLKKAYRLYGPVKEKSYFSFKALGADDKPEMRFSNTRLSPKSIIYPQTEVILSYSTDEADENHGVLQEVQKDYSPRAIIGIRPCDAYSYLLVRRNFDTPEYKDPYWIQAYEATTFVGLACDSPCETCFCTSSGCGPFNEEGLDVLLVDSGDDGYLAKLLTEKGEKLAEAAGWNAEAPADAADTIDKGKTDAESKISSSVETDHLKAQTILSLYEAPFWESEAFACINCGTCTYSCPTCWCFDIQDETFGKSGVRIRNWDSCMYPLFTLHASGHNPRTVKYERVRQRFMHKLKYYVDKYDNGIQCVGCGRCVRLCPVNIDIRRICNLMNSHDPEACTCEAKAS